MKWLLPPLLCLLSLVAISRRDACSNGADFAPAISLERSNHGSCRRVAARLGVRAVPACRTNINTFRDPNVLVTDGAFAFTRNPMYLGFVLTLLGAALISNAISALAIPLLFFLIANAWYVPFEERAAAAQFGEAYAAYKARVRRWL